MARPRKNQDEEQQAEARAEAPAAEEPAAEETPKKRAPRKKKAEEPVASAPAEATEAPAEVEEAPADEPAPEPVAEEQAPEPEAEAAAEPEAVEAGLAPPQEKPQPAAQPEPAPAPEPTKKRKRLPRAERRQRPKRVLARSGERRPLVRIPKPEHERGNRKERRGVVVSAAMDKTIVVRVDTLKAHPVYKKVVRRSRKLHAHDEGNVAKAGDIVRIVESRPLSKTKAWRLAEVLEEAK